MQQIHRLRHMDEKDTSRVWMPWRKIGRLMHLHHMTCVFALKRYKAGGHQLVDQRVNNGKTNNRRVKITPDAKSHLLNHQTLKDQSGFTLSQRCHELRLEKGVSVSPNALKQFYNKHKVRYYVANYQYQQAHKRSQDKVHVFALQLARLIQQKALIVYTDESSFNLWLHQKRTWFNVE